MISQETKDQYTVTIGIECHVQLKTATKLFAAVGNDAREAEPNTLVSHVCFGMPGALPVLNEEAVRLGAKAAFALGTTPQPFSKFDRKHYFYPDLPKGYQITQFDQPIVLGGSIDVEVDGHPMTIGITRAHLEEDAGKSTHPAGADYSLVDLNRAGTPLLEIVSEPDMHSAAEAKAYARELYLRMRYADVSDANLYYGNMRFDVNVSVSKTEQLGTRTETKNLNSFRSVEKAVEYEVSRQIEELEKGNAIVQETRGWDDSKQRTFSQRTKEDAHDYRYFADPDIPPVVLSDDYIEAVRKSMPVMPDQWRERLSGLGLDRSQTDVLLESEIGHEDVDYLSLVEQSANNQDFARQLSNWFVNIEIPLRSREDSDIRPANIERHGFYAAVYLLLKEQKLSSTNAKAFITSVLESGEYPEDAEAAASAAGFIQVSDTAAIAGIVSQVVADNPKAVDDVRAGEAKAIGFLVGQVMKLSQGKANPQMAQQMIRAELGVE